MNNFQPPPRRTDTPPAASASTSTSDPAAGGWKSKMKAKGAVWGKVAMEKGVAISDKVGGRVNDVAEKKFGTEHFWPVTGDFGREMDKCARILRAFTVDGVLTEEKASTPTTETPPEGLHSDAPADKKKAPKKVKVLRKIPPQVIANAKGLVIFTSFRTGIAPFGGAGGAGVVIAKLPDGSWSAPSSVSPNNLSAGFLLGIDVYDAILIINSQPALDSFRTHKATLGAELAVVAGPFGAGLSAEAGREMAPIWSYVKSRGVYAGVEVVGQVFVERFDENAAMYHWPGIKAGDILAGKVKPPREAAALIRALQDAETGRAQAEHDNAALDIPLTDGTSVSPRRLPPPLQPTPGAVVPDESTVQLHDGEILHLPPTPEQVGDSGMTPIDERERAGLGMGPTLPPRLPSRPGIQARQSSASNYSEGGNAPIAGLTVDEVSGGPAGSFAQTGTVSSEKAAAPSPAQALTSDRPPSPTAREIETGLRDEGDVDAGPPPPTYAESLPDYASPSTHAGAAATEGYPEEKRSPPSHSTATRSGTAASDPFASNDHRAARALPSPPVPTSVQLSAQAVQGTTEWMPVQNGPGEEMDETERREWEQWQEMQRQDALAGVGASAAQGELGGVQRGIHDLGINEANLRTGGQ